MILFYIISNYGSVMAMFGWWIFVCIVLTLSLLFSLTCYMDDKKKVPIIIIRGLIASGLCLIILTTSVILFPSNFYLSQRLSSKDLIIVCQAKGLSNDDIAQYCIQKGLYVFKKEK